MLKKQKILFVEFRITKKKKKNKGVNCRHMYFFDSFYFLFLRMVVNLVETGVN